MTTQQLQEMLVNWRSHIGRGCSETDVAALALAIALSRIADTYERLQTIHGQRPLD
jgi:hypothetical protein